MYNSKMTASSSANSFFIVIIVLSLVMIYYATLHPNTKPLIDSFVLQLIVLSLVVEIFFNMNKMVVKTTSKNPRFKERLISLSREWLASLKEYANKFGFNRRHLRTHIFYGIIIGISCQILTMLYLYYVAKLIPSYELMFISILTLIRTITITPVLEEFVFRGYIITRSAQIFGEKLRLLGGLISILIFAWVHPEHWWIRIVSSIIFTSVYLWRGNNNLVACMYAHAVYNLIANFISFNSP